MTNSISETSESDLIFVIGSNPRENHPVIGAKIKQAHRAGAKVIVADPRRIQLSDEAEVFMQVNVGGNIALINGMINTIIAEDLVNKDYVEKHTKGFEAIKQMVAKYKPEEISDIAGVSAEDIKKAARLYATSKASAIYYAMGITQFKTGTNAVIALSNLALITGQIGRPGTGINPLRGQNNVQGSCDMGAFPNQYSGYQSVKNEEVARKHEKIWKVELPREEGLTLPQMMDAAHHKDLKMLYIMGENPVVSDPDTKHILESLEALDFLVIQDIFMTETAKMADVILPALTFAEKDGTFTNTERRVQRVRKAVQVVKDAKADWLILAELLKRFGHDYNYTSPSEIMDEIAILTPQYSGISYDRIEKSGLQWPVKDKNHMGTPILHVGNPLIGRANLIPVEYELPGEVTDKKYPIILTNGRNLYHYHTRSMTAKTEGLHLKSPESYIEMNPLTCEKVGVVEGDMVTVTSRRGSIQTKVVVTDKIQDGTVFMPFHFAEGSANVLTGTEAIDEKSGEPELKLTAVSVEKYEVV